MDNPDLYDVCVIGAGPAGLASALSCAVAGQRTLLIERGGFERQRLGEHLPPSGIASLAEIGLPAADFYQCMAHRRCCGVRSSWGGKTTVNDYYFHPYGTGLNLCRSSFDATLARHAENAGVMVFNHTRISGTVFQDKHWLIQLNGLSDKAIVARYVIDASGRNAAFAKRQNREIDYFDRQIAIITSWTRPDSGQNLLADDYNVIEPCEPGWWYLCPTANDTYTCMLITDADLLETDQHKLWASVQELLAKSVEIRALLTGFVPSGLPAVCSARSQRLRGTSGQQWCAVGDAAMTFDPLSGHGITKGIRQGWMCGQAITQFLNGEAAPLQQFNQDMQTIFTDYIATRRQYYRMEPRWQHAQFWQRRRTAGDLSPVAPAPP